MKKLANHYKVILEIADSNVLHTQDTGEYNPNNPNNPPDAPPGWLDAYYASHPEQNVGEDENWGGWDEWGGMGAPPIHWPWINDPQGRVPPAPVPPTRPIGWRGSWPPPPGSDYYKNIYQSLDMLLFSDIPSGIHTAADLWDWLYEHRHIYMMGNNISGTELEAYWRAMNDPKFKELMGQYLGWAWFVGQLAIDGALGLYLFLHDFGLIPHGEVGGNNAQSWDEIMERITRENPWLEDPHAIEWQRGSWTFPEDDPSWTNRGDTHRFFPWGPYTPGQVQDGGPGTLIPPDGWWWDNNDGRWRFSRNPNLQMFGDNDWRYSYKALGRLMWDRGHHQWVTDDWYRIPAMPPSELPPPGPGWGDVPYSPQGGTHHRDLWYE